MADIFVPGPLSGKNYGFRIAGDTPTVDEQQRIDAALRQQEVAFAGQYQERFGEDLLPSTGVGAQIGEFFRGIPRGAVGLGETAALGAATLLPERFEAPAREGIRSLGASARDRFAVPIGREGMVGGTLGEGLGSTAPFFALAPFGPAGIAAGATLGGAAGAGEASERARAGDATQEERNLASLGGLGVGLSEIAVPAALRGLFGSLLRSGVPETTIRARLARISTAATAEGAQEAATEFLQNAIEQGIYNPEQDLQEGLIPAGGTGAGVGAIIQGLVELGTRSRGPAAPAAPAVTPPAEPLLALPPPDTPPAAPTLALPPPALALPAPGERDTISPADVIPVAPEAGQVSGAVDSNVPGPRAAATPAPTPVDYNAILDELGVPRAAAVRKAVKSGAIKDDDAFRARLATFARNTTSDRAAVVNEYLGATPEATQEIPDAGTAEPGAGPIAPDAAAGRDGLERGVTELDAEPTTGDVRPAATAAPDGDGVGQPVLGTRDLDVPEGDQPSALTPPVAEPAAVDLTEGDAVAVQNWFAENYPGSSIEDFAPSEAEQRAAQALQQAQAEYDQRFTIRPDEVGPPHRRTRSAQWGSYDLMAAEKSADPAEAAAAKKIRAAEIAVQQPRARRIDDTADVRANLRSILTDLDPAALEDPFPILQAALSDTRVPRIEESFRPQQGAAAETPTSPEAVTVGLGPMSGAIPGVETGAAGQVIPAPVPPAPRFTPEGAAVDPDVASAIAAQEEQDKVAAQDAITAWYETNATPEVKAARARIVIDTAEPAVLPAVDMQAVAELLRRAPKPRAKGKVSPEQAAFIYFSKSPDTNFVLESIAYDQAQKMSPDYDAQGRRVSREADFRRETEFESADEAAFYAGTGAEVAMRAARWIRDNLSEGTRAQVADYTFNKYRPIDYEAAAESRDVRQAQNRNRKAEVDQIVRETYGDGTLDAEDAVDLGFGAEDLGGYDLSSFAGQTEWAGNVHPRVAQLIRSGDFRGAMQGLAITAPSKHLRGLAQKLLARIGDTQVQVVSPDVMNAIRAELSPETPTLGVETPAGVYVHPRNEAQIAAMRREGHDAGADLIEQYGGQILFSETASLAPELVLHEAVHRVADGVLTNASHPLTRQLDKLRVNLLKFMPPTEYGLSNVRELLTEGMTNPVFRQTLSQVNTEGKPYSAWQEFKHIMRNFLRSIMGQQSAKPDTALTALDRVLNSVLASNPNEINSGSVVAASFSPGGARQVARDAIARTRVPTKEDLKRTRAVLQSARIPAAFKGTLMRLAMPLDYVADAAGKYLPSARRVQDLIMQHQADIQKGSSTVMQTTEETAKVLAKYRRDQSVIDTFNQVLFESSRTQIDPRKPRSAYEGYSYQYNVLDKDGNIVRRVESPRFKTEVERNKALQAHNAKLTPEQRKNPVARAKRAFDENAEQLQDFGRLKAMRDRLPADVQTELSRMFELQPAMGKELVDAIRTRLEALLPQQKALQDKVFGMIYDKMLAGQLLDPYVALRRTGQFWLSYSAVDPMSITRDPVTGALDYSNAQIEQFKHTFETEGQRAAAMQLLQGMPADQQVTNIHAYQNVGSQSARPTVPLEFVAGVLDAIDGSEALSRAVDPETGDTANIRTQVIELMFNTLPETSFMNSFKKREGIRGFIGDTTPITQGLTAGDTVKNLRESAMRISRQATDLKYGAEFSAVRKALTDEATAFQNTNPSNVDAQTLSRQRTEAAQYYDLLTEYTGVPFRQRSSISRSLTGGAYMLTLGFNVSTALITMSQIPLFVAPFLSGKHGMGRTLSAIGEAHRLLTSSGRERTVERIGPDGQIEQARVPVRIYDFSLDNYDFAQPENAYLSPLHDIAKRNGVFNRSLMQDELLGEQATAMQKIAATTGVMQHHAERYSRETALMASYHLELQDVMGQQAMPLSQFVQQLKDGTLKPTAEQSQSAAMDAVNTSEKTNGPIYAASGPMASQNDIGAILYLFKRHPLSMLNLIGQTAIRANPFGTNDPADRKIAQRQFGGMLGMIGVMSGTMGLPLMQQVGMLYDLMFADDDEPDFETVVRTTLGEAGAFGLVDFLTGTKISERIGLGGALYRPGFASENLPLPYQFIEGVGGPVVGLGLKYLDRLPKLIEQGEYQRALETALPTALANVARATRFSTEGIQTMRGDIVLDDVGPFSLGAQAFGFMPAQYAQQLAMNSVGSRINNAIDTKRTQLLKQRYKAYRARDIDTVRQIDEDIRAFNERHPTNAITGKTLRDSLRSHEQTTARTHHGLSVSPRNEAAVRSVLDLYGPVTPY